MTMRQALTFTAFVVLIGLFSVVMAQQAEDAACPALVELALSQVGNNCGDLGRNSACYGFNQVEATFIDVVDTVPFDRPADRAELKVLQSLQTSPADLGLNQWGIAVLNIQADIPDTLPGQAVTFLLMGDTEIENAVPPTSDQPPVTVITQKAAELRAGQGRESGILTTVPAGTVVNAVAMSEDGDLIRVITDVGTGWLPRTALNKIPALNDLPILARTGQTPMQSFFFRTRPGGTDCVQTPSLLAVRSPENLKVELTANGATFRLGSLVVMRMSPEGDTMNMMVLEGEMVMNPDTPDEMRVPEGMMTSHCMDEPQDLGMDGEANDQMIGSDCEWEEPRDMTLSEKDEIQVAMAALERLDAGAAPEPTPTPAPAETPDSTACVTGTTLVHTVSAGENLFRIAQRYRTSISAIMQANGLTDPSRILAGQQLTIVCGVDTGAPSVPPAPPAPPQTNPPSTVDCAPFRATSPLDGLNYGLNTFYWDAAPGATAYRLNIYNVDERGGALVASYNIAAPQTNFTADLNVQTVGYGFSFAWEVLALSGDQTACTSARVTIPRAPVTQPQAPAGPTNTFSATWYCTGIYAFQVDFSGMPAGTTSVTISFAYSGGAPTPFPPTSVTVPPDPGSASFVTFGPSTLGSGTVTANPSGTTVALPGTISC
jgi:LysM repeat protein